MPDLNQERSPAIWPWYALAVLVVVLDQISKKAILSAFQLGEGRVMTDFFNLVFVFNRGAAFSFLAGADGWQRWFFAALALGVSAYITVLFTKHRADRLMCAALSLIMGGAIGNVIDRFIHGAVVDFLDFHAAGWHFPAFNLADSAITLGVVLLFWQQLREPARN